MDTATPAARLDHVAHRAGNIRIAQPATAAERTALHRFRYDVYVTEMHRVQLHADHARRSITDPLDATGIDLVAWLGAQVVGCVRLNLARDGRLGDYVQFYAMHEASPLHPLHSAIVTRLMVAPAYRNSPLPAQLCAAVYDLALRLDVRVGYIDCNTHLRKFFRRLGFIAHVPERMHPEYGCVQPMRLDMFDADHLRAVRSPFLPVLRQYHERHMARTATTTAPGTGASIHGTTRSEHTLTHTHIDTRKHAAIAAAFDHAMAAFEASPAITRVLEHRITPRHFAAVLREIHHYAKEDPQLQALAAVYFRGADRAMVQGFFRHASAEIGHDRMALDDIRALGYPTAGLDVRHPLPHTTALTAFPFYQVVYRNPIGYLGYLYFLEHMPTRAGARLGAALLACGVPASALSFLNEHTTVDVAHNRLMTVYIDALVRTEADLAAITYAIRTTAVLYADMLQGAIEDADDPEDYGVDHCELARSTAADDSYAAPSRASEPARA